MNENIFENTYDVVSHYILLPSGNKSFIGKKKPSLCRYCKRNEEDTTFKKRSHAIPEFLGNKTLIANDECDQCNQHFSSHVEEHLAKYLEGYRTIAGMRGKKSVPKYKSNDSRFEMYVSGEQNSIICDERKGEHLELNEITKTIKIPIVRPPYVPAAVYKCFVKMAIAIAPEGVLGDLNDHIKWILETDHTIESSPYLPLVIYEHFTTGGRPYSGIGLYLLKRKSDQFNVPYLQFICTFGNSTYQVVLPIVEKDCHLDSKDIELYMFPTPFDNDDTKVTTTKALDFSNFKDVRGEVNNLFVKFDELSHIS